MGLSHSPRIVTNGLVLCLDAGNTRSYPGSGTTWTDLSGNGNNGTLTNGPTFSSSNGGSIVFDGTNDYIDGPGISSQFTTDMTAEAWILVTSRPTSSLVRIVGTGITAGGANNRTFGLWHDGTGRLIWQRYFDGTSNDMQIYPVTPTINLNQWYHIVGTTSGSSHVLYLNGSSIGTQTKAGPWLASSSNITIGFGPSISIYHTGNISNVKLYNRALSATEIRQNFNATRGRYGI